MVVPFFLQAFLLGFQHTFEPDHLAAVSVLATSKSSMRNDFRRMLWRSSQWALGHGLTLMLLSVAALAFKSSLPEALSGFVEVWVIGPLMIGLGALALWRGFTAYSHEHPHVHAPSVGDAAHVHGPIDLPGVEHSAEHASTASTAATEHAHVHVHVPGERLRLFNRSFGVGMLHGAAGTGGALAVALGLAANSPMAALGILLLESIGVLVAMSAYALLLVYAAKRLAARHNVLMRGVNFVVGSISVVVGIVWLQRGLMG